MSLASCSAAAKPFRGPQPLREVDVVPDLFHAESGDEYRGEVGVLMDLEPAAPAAP